MQTKISSSRKRYHLRSCESRERSTNFLDDHFCFSVTRFEKEKKKIERTCNSHPYFCPKKNCINPEWMFSAACMRFVRVMKKTLYYKMKNGYCLNKNWYIYNNARQFNKSLLPYVNRLVNFLNVNRTIGSAEGACYWLVARSAVREWPRGGSTDPFVWVFVCVS